jgi:hypothetical protein
MDPSKPDSLLQALELESENNSLHSLGPEPELCSWGHKPANRGPAEGLRREKKEFKLRFSNSMRKKATESFGRIKKRNGFVERLVEQAASRSPSMGSREGGKKEEKGTASLKLKKGQVVELRAMRNENSENSGFRPSPKGVRTAAKLFRVKMGGRERMLKNNTPVVKVSKELIQKIGEMINKPRSPSPRILNCTPKLYNKMQLYNASTVEELIHRAKVPDFLYKRKQKQRGF